MRTSLPAGPRFASERLAYAAGLAGLGALVLREAFFVAAERLTPRGSLTLNGWRPAWAG